jgi:hypothetical protein
MSRRPRFLGRKLLPFTVSILGGLAVGVGVSGLPDSEALNPIAGRPPITVKPGALIDPSELTVPPLVLPSSSLAPSESPPESTTTTSTPATSTTPTDGLRPRTELVIMVANGNGGRGVATQRADQIQQLGYARPQLSDTAITVNWVVYYAPGFEREASRLIQDWGISILTSAPLDQGPATRPGFEGQLLVVIGSKVLESTATTTTTVAVSP